MLKFGIDRAEEFSHLFTGRVALVTSPTGRTSKGVPTAQVLRSLCNLRLLLAPEHGIRGDRAAGELFCDSSDPDTGLPVRSLYSEGSKRLPEDVFSQIDCFIYDIQDVGCRYYTFISTLKYMIEDCAAHGKRVVVLDRPNPLGRRVEGNLLQTETKSFVGCQEMPVLYGLTCGEFAAMVNTAVGCDLHIVPCTGWHGEDFSKWEKEWIAPSPNLPRFSSALVYSAACLLEGTNCSEGRGTEDPFAILGAPFVDETALCNAFLRRKLPGITCVPCQFTPSTSKFQGEVCRGIHLKITDPSIFTPTEAGLHILDLLRALYPKDFQLLPVPAQDTMPFISRLSGHRLFEQDGWDLDSLIASGRAESQKFAAETAKYHLY